MNFAIVAFTGTGCRMALRIRDMLICEGQQGQAFGTESQARTLGLEPFGDLPQWTQQTFRQADVLIFIGACGIAVRAIAPWLSDKFTDPAVLVADEQGQFVISLLSGHAGGANRLAQRIAAAIGGIAVVTTATDVQGIFAVDQWATEQGMTILERELSKKISARLLGGESVGFHCSFPVTGPLPQGILKGIHQTGFAVTLDEWEKPFQETLHVIPPLLTLGIGCRKGTAKDMIRKAVMEVLVRHGLSPKAVRQVCTIDLKGGEAGLLAFCHEQGYPLMTYTAQALKAAGTGFTGSAFVDKTIGVDNVCERAAVLGSGGRLIIKKQCVGPVTVAAAIEPFTLHF